LQAFTDFQLFIVAIAGDARAVDIFHYKVGLAVCVGTGVEDFCDDRRFIRARDWRSDSKRRMTWLSYLPPLMSLKGHETLYRRGSFGEPDLAHAACAQLTKQIVGTDGREVVGFSGKRAMSGGV
jgi:hypothetical protein